MKISQIHLNDEGLPAPTPEVEQERKVAIFDLLEDNAFALTGKQGGPYELTLSIQDKLLVLEAEDDAKTTPRPVASSPSSASCSSKGERNGQRHIRPLLL